MSVEVTGINKPAEIDRKENLREAKKKHWSCCIKNLQVIIRESKLLGCTVLRLDH